VKADKKEMNSDVRELEAVGKDFDISLKELRIRKSIAATNNADMQTARKRIVGGYWHSLLDKIYQKVGMEREAYHGGDFNGVYCRRLMANANRFYDLWLELILETHDPIQSTVAVDELRERMERC
jgi:hypothetical protein